MPQKPQPTPQTSSFGSALKGAAASGLESAVGALPAEAIGSALNGLFGLASARMNYKYNKKLMALQNQYSIDAFNRENARQDQLLYNSAAMQRHGLASAGYSTADPSGTGFQQPAVGSMDTPTNPSAGMVDLGKFDLMQAAQLRLLNEQAKNVQANTLKTTAETRYQDMQNDLFAVYGEEQIKSALANVQEDTRKKHEEALFTDQQRLNSIALTDAQIEEISSKIDIAYQKLDPELKLLAAEAFKADQDGKLSKAKISEVYQNIKESQERINLMKTQEGLNNAQTDVAISTAKNIVQQTRTEGWKTVEQMQKAQMAQFEQTLQQEMGYTAAKAKKIVETIFPVGALFGLFMKKQ